MTVEAILVPIITAVVLSLSFYFKKTAGAKPEEFDIVKFGTTVIIGTALGIAAIASGLPITEQSIETQFLLYAGAVAVVENLLQTVYRKYKEATRPTMG